MRIDQTAVRRSKDSMNLSFKIYEYPHYRFYYLTLNGVQFGGVMFSQREVDEAIGRLK